MHAWTSQLPPRPAGPCRSRYLEPDPYPMDSPRFRRASRPRAPTHHHAWLRADAVASSRPAGGGPGGWPDVVTSRALRKLRPAGAVVPGPPAGPIDVLRRRCPTARGHGTGSAAPVAVDPIGTRVALASGWQWPMANGARPAASLSPAR